MDRIIEVKVNGNYLFKDNKNAGVQYEANVTSLRIEFDAGWDGYAKKVTFWDAVGGNPVERTLTTDLLEDITSSTRIYLCPIPGEPMLIAGNMTFVIDGYVDGKRQRSISDKLRVKEAPFKETAGEPADPTPTQAEQLQVQIDTLLSDMAEEATKAVNAKTAAETAKSEAEAAKTAAEKAKANAGLWAYASEENRKLADEARAAAEAAQAAAEAAQVGAEAARDQAEAVVGGDFATKTELSAHTGDSVIHVTAEEKAEWNKSDVFVATYGTTTLDELNAAREAGKHIVCKGINGENAALAGVDTTSFIFTGLTFAGDGTMIYYCMADGWSYNVFDFASYAHASNHAIGGDDPITPASIGAKAATDSDVFVAKYQVTTFDEISSAYSDGKTILMSLSVGGITKYAVLIRAYPESLFMFGGLEYDEDDGMPIIRTSVLYMCDGSAADAISAWSYHGITFALNDHTHTLESIGAAAKIHASTHASGGSDPITPESIGAAPAYTYGTEDLTAGTSELATGKLYFVFE